MPLTLTVFNPSHPVIDAAHDWGIQTFDRDNVDDQPFKIATVPALFDDPDHYNYHRPMCGLDLSQFDLVLISDIEYTNYTRIYEWTARHHVQSFAAAVGGLFSDLPLDTQHMVYRPWWMENVQRLNQDYVAPSPTEPRPFLFDALLGTRRPHRDYVMLEMQRHPGVMRQSIVNYRHVFTPGRIPMASQLSSQKESQTIADLFPDHALMWPYVSRNLDPAWEVADEITHSVSQTIPTGIYQRTWYSILCETVHTGTAFFMAEKFTKTVLARRAFVMFGPMGYLARLRELGFQTFDSVIDESYDWEPVDIRRYQLAWSQVLSLSQRDAVQVNQRLQDVFDHNRQNLDNLWKITQQRRRELLWQKVPAKYQDHCNS